jgi:hypothetical protein
LKREIGFTILCTKLVLFLKILMYCNFKRLLYFYLL